MKILVSACLLGDNCKYNGGNNFSEKTAAFVRGKDVIKICPELLAGMGAPRPPVELADGRLIDHGGRDVDAAYRAGVAEAMRRIAGEEIELVILQSRSPTCGVKQVYDGTFSGKLIDGRGLFADALVRAGYRVVDVEDLAIDN